MTKDKQHEDRKAIIEEHKHNLEALSSMTGKAFDVMKNISTLQQNYFHKTFNEFICMISELAEADEVDNPHELRQRHEERIHFHRRESSGHQESIQQAIESAHEQIASIFRDRLETGFHKALDRHRKKNSH